jgi:hypothetical protein
MMSSIRVLLLRPDCSFGLPTVSGSLINELRQSGCNVIPIEKLTTNHSPWSGEDLNEAMNAANPDIIVCVVASERCPYLKTYQCRPTCMSACSRKALGRLGFCVHSEWGVIITIPPCFNTMTGRVQYSKFYDKGEGLTLHGRIVQLVQNEVVRRYCPPDVIGPTAILSSVLRTFNHM